MAVKLDAHAATAIFTLPRNDGVFDREFALYLNELGSRRRLAMIAFPPKAAGTFFRSAVIEAIDGQLARTIHAQGGRDGTPYMPTFIAYYNGGAPQRTLVTHVHMQALPANRRFVEAFDIRPLVMIRSIPDMLASYWDMLDDDPDDPSNWLNTMLPAGYGDLAFPRKADFFVDTVAPWYASYYASWLDYAQTSPQRVGVLHYRDFRKDPAGVLETALRHMMLERPRDVCERAIDAVGRERRIFRFHRGEEGRGASASMPGISNVWSGCSPTTPCSKAIATNCCRAIRPPAAMARRRLSANAR